jgi:hypothetical protein
MIYKLGIAFGGLMEQPEYTFEDVLEIEADTLDEAIDKWAIKSGQAKYDTWNAERRTVWGNKVVTDEEFIKKYR